MRTTHVVLAAAHLDSDPANNRLRNLRALCQRCHLLYDRRDFLEGRPPPADGGEAAFEGAAAVRRGEAREVSGDGRECRRQGDKARLAAPIRESVLWPQQGSSAIDVISPTLSRVMVLVLEALRERCECERDPRPVSNQDTAQHVLSRVKSRHATTECVSVELLQLDEGLLVMDLRFKISSAADAYRAALILEKIGDMLPDIHATVSPASEAAVIAFYKAQVEKSPPSAAFDVRMIASVTERAGLETGSTS